MMDECYVCDGTGSLFTDGQWEDCWACDGDGVYEPWDEDWGDDDD